jgi:hypothetical protein
MRPLPPPHETDRRDRLGSGMAFRDSIIFYSFATDELVIEGALRSVIQNNPRTRNPIGLLSVDKMTYNIKRAPRIGAFFETTHSSDRRCNSESVCRSMRQDLSNAIKFEAH